MRLFSKKFILLWIGWWTYHGLAHAQTPVTYLEQVFTANEGLPYTKTHRIFQDSRGFLWIGTEAGLSRYDGHTFINYSRKHGLPFNLIRSIREDGHGTLWVGTGNGLAFYDGNRFHGVNLPVDSSLQQTIQDILCLNDTIWVTSSVGLFRYTKTKFEQVPLPDKNIRCTDLQFSSKWGLLIGTNKGILRLSGTSFSLLHPSISQYILHLKTDTKQRVWATSLNGKIYCIENSFCDSIEPELCGAETPNALLIKDSQVFYTGSTTLYEIKNKQDIKQVVVATDDPTGFIADFIQDSENQFWLATTYGLMRLKKNDITVYKTKTPELSNVYCIQKHRTGDTLLLGSLRSLLTLKGDSVVQLTHSDPLLLSEITFIAPHPEEGWLIGQDVGNLLRIHGQPGNKTSVQEGITSIRTFCFALAPDSSIWIGSPNNLYHIKKGKVDCFSTLPVMQVNIMSALALLTNEILVGTNRGLYLFSKEKFTPVAIPGLVEGSVINSLSLTKQGHILIATKGSGIYIADFRMGKLTGVRHLSTDNGLGSDFIHRAIEDHVGQLWLLSGNGIYRVKNYHSDKPLIEYINRDDGMPDNSWSFGDLYEDNNGVIYIGGSKNLVSLKANTIFAPARARVNSYILGLSSGFSANSPMNDSLFWNNPMASVSLPYSANSIKIYFTGISLSRPEKVLYTFFLEGFDQNWSMPSPARSVSYSNLPPGSYLFHLKANNQTIGSEGKESIINIVIQTPFWMSWWFRSVIAMLIASLAFIIYRWRTHEHFKKQQLQLESNKKISESRFMAFQARMNPHFMFNSLNAIQYFITNNDKQSTLNYLSKFARLLRQILDNSKESKITIESELQMLKTYIEMENMRFENKFSYTFEIDPDVDIVNTEIPGMIIQPFAENAIIHGLLHKQGKGHLKIQITKTLRQIICIVEDDGIGRNRSAEINAGRSPNHRSHGMDIALNRLELLSNEQTDSKNCLEITDLYPDSVDTGTKVIIRLPIH